MQPDEQRVEHADDGVVHLGVADLLDATFFHVGDRAAGPQRFERAAVAVGREGQGVLVFQQHLVRGHVDGGHHGLGEDHHVGRVEAEVVVFLKDRPRVCVVDGAGHHVPGHRGAVLLLGLVQVFGKAGEQRGAADRRGGEGALGPVPAQPRALAAGDGEGGDLAFGDERLAVGAGLGVARLVSVLRNVGVPRGGLKAFGDREGGLGFDVGLDQPGDFGPVDAFDLSQQRVLLRFAERVVVGQHVGLAHSVEGGLRSGVAFGQGHGLGSN